jgi:hypothetical protein
MDGGEGCLREADWGVVFAIDRRVAEMAKCSGLTFFACFFKTIVIFFIRFQKWSCYEQTI